MSKNTGTNVEISNKADLIAIVGAWLMEHPEVAGSDMNTRQRKKTGFLPTEVNLLQHFPYVERVVQLSSIQSKKGIRYRLFGPNGIEATVGAAALYKAGRSKVELNVNVMTVAT